jgi:LPS-assembly lipoprotein
MMRRLLPLIAVLLAACGFQLRGAYTLPYKTLHIAQPETSELRAAIKRQVEAATETRIIDDAKAAQASLQILSDTNQKNILSLSSAGKVREFQLVRLFIFRIVDAQGKELVSPGTIRVAREITFDDTRVLAKESEEALLWRDIQADLVQQLLRRLAAAKPKLAEPKPAEP